MVRLRPLYMAAAGIIVIAVCAAVIWPAGFATKENDSQQLAVELYERAGGLRAVPWERFPVPQQTAPDPVSGSDPPLRLVIVAVDRMDPRIVGTLIAQNRLPNISAVISQGAYGPIQAPSANAPVNWTTAFTGLSPKEHGIDPQRSGLEYMTRLQPRELVAPRIWEIAEQYGLSIGLYAVPFTAPRPAMDSAAVPGFRFGKFTRFLPARLSAQSCGISGDESQMDFMELKFCCLADAPHQLDIVRLRSLGGAADVGLAQFLWQRLGRDAAPRDADGVLADSYVELDRALGGLRAGCGRDTVLVVCSDRGIDMESAASFKLNLGPAILDSFGITGRDTWSGSASVPLFHDTVRAHSQWELYGVRTGAVDKYNRPTRMLVLVQALEFRGNRFAPGDLFENVRDHLDSTVGADSGLFEVVPLDFRSAVLRPRPEALEAALAQEPLSEERLKVLRPDFDIRRLHPAPGFIALCGPGIKPGAEIHDARLSDLAPTALALLGLPVSEQIGGRVLDEAFTDGFLAAGPVNSIPAYEIKSLVRDDELPSDLRPQNPLVRDPYIDRRLKLLGYVQYQKGVR